MRKKRTVEGKEKRDKTDRRDKRTKMERIGQPAVLQKFSLAEFQ